MTRHNAYALNMKKEEKCPPPFLLFKFICRLRRSEQDVFDDKAMALLHDFQFINSSGAKESRSL